MRLAVEHLVVAREGEAQSGDAVFVRLEEIGGVFAVIDGLGHGEHAAAASQAALDALRQAPPEERVAALIDRVHVALRGTRGAAGMICTVREGRLEGCGVGNVDLVSAGTRVPVLLSPGILGGSIAKCRIFEARLAPKDRLVLFSDGISPRFDLSRLRGIGAAEACRTLMRKNRRPHDDATVLVADIEP